MFYFVPVSYAAQSSRSGREILMDDDPLLQPLPPGIKVRAFIHTPRVIEPNHLGTCQPTSSSGDQVNAFEVEPWHLPPGGITWKLSEATVATEVSVFDARTAITAAFNTWSNADTDGSKIFNDGGTTTVKNTRLDGTNAILWKRLRAGVIGETYVWYDTATGEVVEVDTAFNNRHPWAIFDGSGGECQTTPDAFDLQNIATHEFGHWIGLGDILAAVDLTMYGFGAGGELKKRTLGTGDISGANFVQP